MVIYGFGCDIIQVKGSLKIKMVNVKLEVSDNKITPALKNENNKKFRDFTMGPGAPIGPCGPTAPLKIKKKKHVLKKDIILKKIQLTNLMYTFDPRAPFSPFWPSIPLCP